MLFQGLSHADSFKTEDATIQCGRLCVISIHFMHTQTQYSIWRRKTSIRLLYISLKLTHSLMISLMLLIFPLLLLLPLLVLLPRAITRNCKRCAMFTCILRLRRYSRCSKVSPWISSSSISLALCPHLSCSINSNCLHLKSFTGNFNVMHENDGIVVICFFLLSLTAATECARQSNISECVCRDTTSTYNYH